MAEQKTSTTPGNYLTVLLAIGIAALVLGTVIAVAGGTPAFFFVIGGIMVLAWLIIKAAKS